MTDNHNIYNGYSDDSAKYWWIASPSYSSATGVLAVDGYKNTGCLHNYVFTNTSVKVRPIVCYPISSFSYSLSDS